MKMEDTECSETSAYKIQAPGNYPQKRHTTFRTRRKFEIKKFRILSKYVPGICRKLIASSTLDRAYDALIIHSFIHSVFCLTTGPKPPPKRCLHIVRCRASSFKWEYSLLSLRSSSSSYYIGLNSEKNLRQISQSSTLDYINGEQKQLAFYFEGAR